jgi:ParB family chromosome partitioning protein
MKRVEINNIPIGEIFIANPRSRNRKKWLEIVTSVREVGLKRPITVSQRVEPTGDGKRFDLVCGQGRIEAFLELGEKTIPAIVITVSREDQFLMSLVENLARRQPSNRDILREVIVLRGRGYKAEQIAAKLGVDRVYAYGLVHLIERGEESLVEHVEAGRLPLSVAIEIAGGNDHAVSLALSEAYQSGLLRGAKLRTVRRIVAARNSKQETQGTNVNNNGQHLTGDALAKVYERTVQDQRALVARAEKANGRMLLLCSAFRQMLADDNFVKLLRDEKLSDMPEKLAQRLK